MITQSTVVGRADLIDQVTNAVTHAGTCNPNPIAFAAIEATNARPGRPGCLRDAQDDLVRVRSPRRRCSRFGS